MRERSTLLDVVLRRRTLLVLALVVCLLVAAAIVDFKGSVVNALTELVGVSVGTYLTVAVLDQMRRQREERERRDLRHHGLQRELATNLAAMVNRHRSSAVEKHGMLARVRQQRPITVNEITDDQSTTDLSHDEAMRVALAVFGRVRREHLQSDAINQAIAGGYFLEVSDTGVTETEVHKALLQLRDDFTRLETLDRPSDVIGKWDDRLIADVTPSLRAKVAPIPVRTFALLMAYSHFDAMSDIFAAHVAILRWLMNPNAAFETPQRGPQSPFGDAVESELKAERVLPSEVMHLLTAGIVPFGPLPAADVFGDDREAQINTLVRFIRRSLQDAGLDPALASEDSLREIATTVIDTATAPPEAGIEILRRVASRPNPGAVPPADSATPT